MVNKYSIIGDKNMFLWIGIFIKVIPFIHTMMDIAEKMFDDIPDSGAEKKAMVLEAVKSLIQTLLVLTSEEDFEKIWVKIEKPISILINATCLVLFPHMDDEKEK